MTNSFMLGTHQINYYLIGFLFENIDQNQKSEQTPAGLPISFF